MSLSPRSHVLPVLALLLFAMAGTPPVAAHEAPSDTWFPVQLPVDSYADTWGAPRSGGRGHEGVDVMAPQMREVYASTSGRIIKAKGEDCPPGTACSSFYLAVAGDDGRGYFYVHLNNDQPGRPDGCDGRAGYDGAFSPRLVRELEARGSLEGVRVERGEHIGYVGSSGNAACGQDQLHYEIWNDHDWGATGKTNPYPVLREAESAGRSWGPDGAPPAPVPTSRDAGADRVATAARLSQRSYAQADTVVIAPADDHAPALVAAPLAARLGGPVLLNVDRDGDPVSDVMAEEVRRLGPDRVLLVGTAEQVPVELRERVASEVGLDREAVGRITAPDRYALSVAVAEAMEDSGVAVERPLVSLGDHPVAGREWPDALAASSLGAAQQAPVLLVRPDAVPATVRRFLTERAVQEVRLTGGPEAVAPAVEDDLERRGLPVRRLAGATRYETALAVADELLSDTEATTETVHVATGRNFPDAVTAGPALAVGGSMLVLVDGQLGPPDSVLDWLRARAPGIARLHGIGGPDAVSGPVLDHAARYAAWPR